MRQTGAKIRKEREAVAEVAAQLLALETMTVRALSARYEEAFGEPTRSRNKEYLKKQIAWRIQELAEGGLSERARARALEIGGAARIRWRRNRATSTTNSSATTRRDERDPRLPPPGTTITRVHRGVVHEVVVLQDGFEYRGERHPNLSRIAKLITGTNWNGFLFWRLQQRTRHTRADP